jgi:multiple RNA-binding domain-containing protein 1
VIIQKKQKGSAMLSQGYGFAEFQSVHHAQFSLSKIHDSLLDSYKLDVKPSDKRISQTSSTMVKKTSSSLSNSNNSCKLIIRNVAFQATKSEIRQLFSAFGSVKKVRIPKKMGGNHRGFAFVDFSTSQEASNAMTALKSTHLYGRHLVIEWAKEEDDEDDGDEEDHPSELVNKAVEASRKRAQNDQKNINAVNQKAKRQKAVIDGDDVEGGTGGGEMKELI